NPHADLQAQDRAHRIGQTKAMRILRLITKKSMKEAMYACARYKPDINNKVIQDGRRRKSRRIFWFIVVALSARRHTKLILILEANQEEENEEVGDMNDNKISSIIARTDEEEKFFSDLDIQREHKLPVAMAWKAAGNRGEPPQLRLGFGCVVIRLASY
ncbi:hypothetical protein HETIRDRAFT_307999, partial [Heterobasidion irregulare TC 32-1]